MYKQTPVHLSSFVVAYVFACGWESMENSSCVFGVLYVSVVFFTISDIDVTHLGHLLL